MKKKKADEFNFMNHLSGLIPGHSLDCVILGYRDGNLHVLLLELKETGLWGLPGGFIRLDEDLDDAARRVLKERTGLEYPFLKQFHTFGDPGRRDSQQLHQLLETFNGRDDGFRNWLLQRFITTAYFALVNINHCGPLRPDAFSRQCLWIPVLELPELIFDHALIITQALKQLRREMKYLPVGKNLLPEPFTMKDLQQLHEAILGYRLDRANFQRKILKSGLLVRVARKTGAGPHKAPYLYRFNTENEPSQPDVSK